MLGLVRDGVGGERYVASSSVLESFAARFARRITLGGTNVRAAVVLSRLGLSSTVHLVSIDDHVRRLLPPQVSYLCSASSDSTDPHVIVQFPRGAEVRVADQVLQAPRANRLIYVHDLPNREMVLSPELGERLAAARVFLISGFNAMQDRDTLDRRLRTLREQMAGLRPDAVVVFEDAGYHVPEFSHRVRAELLDLIDVYGMNEDELQTHLGRALSLLDADAVAVALKQLQAVVPARMLVVHTAFWSLAYGSDAVRYRGCLQTATAVAGARYLRGDDFSEADYRSVRRGPSNPQGQVFAARLEALLPDEVVCVPSPQLETATPTTVGLGDSFVGGFVAALAGY